LVLSWRLDVSENKNGGPIEIKQQMGSEALKKAVDF
jgi:hypothetical protein